MLIQIKETEESVKFKANTLVSRGDFEEMVNAIMAGKEIYISDRGHPSRKGVAEYVSDSLVWRSQQDLVKLLCGNTTRKEIIALEAIKIAMRKEISENLEMAFNDYDIRIAEDV